MHAQDPKAVFAQRSFLLVEDFEAMRGILRELLMRCGARHIEVAANAREALNILRKTRCDIVICDYHLGEGKNGQQLLEEARHEGLANASTVWIMVTAEKTFSMVMSAVEHQPDDYLIKPITEATLQTRLGRLLARKQALSEISAAMHHKEYLRALELCKQRLAQDRSNPMEIQRILGEIYQHLGQFDEAHQLYDAILARREITWARLGMAKLHFHQHKYARAHALLEQLINDNPNYLDAYDWMARLYAERGSPEDAEHILSQAVALSPNSPVRQTALGDAALRCEHFEVAERAYARAIKLCAHSRIKQSNAYLGLAKVYTAQHKTAEALRILAQLTDEVHGDEVTLLALGQKVRIYHAAGQNEQASAAASELATIVHRGIQHLPAHTLIDLAETLVLMDDMPTAQLLLQFVLRNNNEDDALAARAQDIYTRAGQQDLGRALIEQTRQEAVSMMNEGVRLAVQGRTDDAMECMLRARELMPRNPRLLLNYAWLLINRMQKQGWRYDLETEARRMITLARQIVPGEKRCGELLTQLEGIANS